MFLVFLITGDTVSSGLVTVYINLSARIYSLSQKCLIFRFSPKYVKTIYTINVFIIFIQYSIDKIWCFHTLLRIYHYEFIWNKYSIKNVFFGKKKTQTNLSPEWWLYLSMVMELTSNQLLVFYDSTRHISYMTICLIFKFKKNRWLFLPTSFTIVSNLTKNCS